MNLRCYDVIVRSTQRFLVPTSWCCLYCLVGPCAPSLTLHALLWTFVLPWNLVERIICTFLFGPAVLLFSFQSRLPIEEASGSNTSFRTLAWIEIFSLQRVTTWLLASAVLQSLRPGSTWQLVELVLVWCFSRCPSLPCSSWRGPVMLLLVFHESSSSKFSNFYDLIVFVFLFYRSKTPYPRGIKTHLRSTTALIFLWN